MSRGPRGQDRPWRGPYHACPRLPAAALLNDPVERPAALSAFLRGVERRGVVLAELQCGRRATGEIAMAATLRAFGQYAGEQPMERWPEGFWSLLAAAPPLQQSAEDADWDHEMAALAGLAPADRLAMLLRLAAGMEEDQAARVLGMDRTGYRQALARACPRDDEGKPDVEGWRALAQAVQLRIRQLPADRIAHLQRLRERMFPEADEPPSPHAPLVTPMAAPPAPVVADQPPPARARGRVRWYWWCLLVAVVVAAAGAWGWWRNGLPAVAVVRTGAPDDGSLGVRALQPAPQVRAEPLGDAPAPQPPADAALASADLDQLMDPQGAALAANAGFLAWYAADPDGRLRQAQALARQPPPQDTVPDPALDPVPGESRTPETSDDAL